MMGLCLQSTLDDMRAGRNQAEFENMMVRQELREANVEIKRLKDEQRRRIIEEAATIRTATAVVPTPLQELSNQVGSHYAAQRELALDVHNQGARLDCLDKFVRNMATHPCPGDSSVENSLQELRCRLFQLAAHLNLEFKPRDFPERDYELVLKGKKA